jgi:hypothetical protein
MTYDCSVYWVFILIYLKMYIDMLVANTQFAQKLFLLLSNYHNSKIYKIPYIDIIITAFKHTPMSIQANNI